MNTHMWLAEGAVALIQVTVLLQVTGLIKYNM